MRKHTRRLIVLAAVAAAAPMILPAQPVNAWIAAGGWGRGGVAVFHPRPCYAGVGAAAVAGMAVGAAVASHHTTVVAPSPTVIVNNPPPVVVAPAAVGTSVTVLPAGAHSLTVNGKHYYQAGNTWYHPAFGNNGVYYTVVPAP